MLQTCSKTLENIKKLTYQKGRLRKPAHIYILVVNFCLFSLKNGTCQSSNWFSFILNISAKLLIHTQSDRLSLTLEFPSIYLLSKEPVILIILHLKGMSRKVLNLFYLEFILSKEHYHAFFFFFRF